MEKRMDEIHATGKQTDEHHMDGSMKERQRRWSVPTVEELKEKSQVDPLTVDKDTLVDIRDVHIRTDLDDTERMLDYMQQIGNPYCYLDNGMVVKISFSGQKPLQECLRDYIF